MKVWEMGINRPMMRGILFHDIIQGK